MIYFINFFHKQLLSFILGMRSEFSDDSAKPHIKLLPVQIIPFFALSTQASLNLSHLLNDSWLISALLYFCVALTFCLSLSLFPTLLKLDHSMNNYFLYELYQGQSVYYTFLIRLSTHYTLNTPPLNRDLWGSAVKGPLKIQGRFGRDKKRQKGAA